MEETHIYMSGIYIYVSDIPLDSSERVSRVEGEGEGDGGREREVEREGAGEG